MKKKISCIFIIITFCSYGQDTIINIDNSLFSPIYIQKLKSKNEKYYIQLDSLNNFNIYRFNFNYKKVFLYRYNKNSILIEKHKFKIYKKGRPYIATYIENNQLVLRNFYCLKHKKIN